ncbi:hypothetical protein MIND_01313600 [Mycena indigotica]|uniref:Uncharacterized protein n=1 Tax=Mycena indigotica TaxID=2126181 RepID=A0A8H6VR65_9AGAR|nr:uncharacterized protein MIND_01313600 [Mycena indigotica]KAF7290729.1 hypothetical protein MIND_01313600 [Mycena indigotica]
MPTYPHTLLPTWDPDADGALKGFGAAAADSDATVAPGPGRRSRPSPSSTRGLRTVSVLFGVLPTLAVFALLNPPAHVLSYMGAAQALLSGLLALYLLVPALLAPARGPRAWGRRRRPAHVLGLCLALLWLRLALLAIATGLDPQQDVVKWIILAFGFLEMLCAIATHTLVFLPEKPAPPAAGPEPTASPSAEGADADADADAASDTETLADNSGPGADSSILQPESESLPDGRPPPPPGPVEIHATLVAGPGAATASAATASASAAAVALASAVVGSIGGSNVLLPSPSSA